MEAKAHYGKEDSSATNIGTIQRVASVAGGTYLMVSALKEAVNSPVNSLLRLLSGGYLIYRGTSGYCALSDAFSHTGKVLNIRTSMFINASPYEVYSLWRNLENLPLFMKHLAFVKVKDTRRSRWAAKLPGGIGTIEWDAEILVDKKGEELSWHSLEGSVIENSGKIVFEEVDEGQATQMHVTITYSPPAGKVGKAVSKLLNDVFENLIREDIRRFKYMAEGSDAQTIQLSTSRTNGHYSQNF
jgi:uncharacterized membrane protein